MTTGGVLSDSRLRNLEAESIEILRELAIKAEQTVILYSVGKDSSALLHLAEKAFYPGRLPFSLMHVDTGFKFEEMYTFRDQVAAQKGLKLIVESNAPAIAKKTNPYDLGTQSCCALLKTEALLGALSRHGFDIAIGGARRDEEKSRAKERIFSMRGVGGAWNPKQQRPEFWNCYNTRLAPNQSMRVFPLSNWTELDIWRYIELEKIEVVPLYFAQPRKMVRRRGQLIPVNQGSRLQPGEVVEDILCRFRTLGCSPCTGAVESSAKNISEIILELTTVQVSERATRIIDHDETSSMEKKKREGYF